MEFLVQIALDVQAVPADERLELLARERDVGLRLRRDGAIERMWRLPGQTGTLSVWRVADATELHERLSEFPLFPWMTVQVTALAQHYLDTDGATGSGSG